MSGDRDYRLFGLRVRSELALPELFEETGGGEPDIVIRRGEIGELAEDEALHPVPGGAMLVIPGIARYLVREGREVIVEAVPGVPERNVRLYLLGSTLGVVLHQRGLLPLHANAIEVDAGAVAFLGHSGAGKSTLAMSLHDRGLRVIADDVCVVRQDDRGHPFVAPGLPRFRLWQEALDAMGRSASDYERSFDSVEQFDKFDVPIAPDSAAEGEVPLLALYILDRSDEVKIDPLRGVEAIEEVFAHTYRGAYLTAAKGHLNHWSSVLRLVESVPVYRLGRPWGFDRLDSCCDLVLGHLRSIRQQSAPVPG